jgi:hypothetical protein
LDGTTEKNWIKYKIDYRIKNTGSFSNNSAIAPGGLTFGELTTTALAGFLTAEVYDIRLRVFDAFYDIDNDASTLEDTDDYAEGITLLPSGDVSMILGKRYASFGKTYDGSGTIDVAEAADGISINADGDIYSRGVKLGNSLSAVYPIGAIYMSVVSTNPAMLFGFGTWAALQNSFLIGASATYPMGKADDAGAVTTADGGETAHTLTIAESGAPSHAHNIRVFGSPTAAHGHNRTDGVAEGASTSNSETSFITGTVNAYAGQNAAAAHNNMPPYLAVYMWKRTA